MKFRAYGFIIESEFETLLPNFQSEHVDARIIDRAVELSGTVIHSVPDFPGGPELHVYDSQECRFVSYRGLTAKIEKSTQTIDADIPDFDDPKDAALFVTQVFERVLLPIAILVWDPSAAAIHASAVSVEERSTVVIGASGVGKSTFAFEMLTRGAKLITDDLALFRDGLISGAAPVVRTWDSLSHTAIELNERAAPHSEKSWLRFSDSHFTSEPTTLKNLIVFKRGTTFSIEPIRGAEKLAILLSHSFALESESTSERFAAVSNLAQSTPMELCTVPSTTSRTEMYDSLRVRL